jgi:hypothetical protein
MPLSPSLPPWIPFHIYEHTWAVVHASFHQQLITAGSELFVRIIIGALWCCNFYFCRCCRNCRPRTMRAGKRENSYMEYSPSVEHWDISFLSIGDVDVNIAISVTSLQNQYFAVTTQWKAMVWWVQNNIVWLSVKWYCEKRSNVYLDYRYIIKGEVNYFL